MSMHGPPRHQAFARDLVTGTQAPAENMSGGAFRQPGDPGSNVPSTTAPAGPIFGIPKSTQLRRSSEQAEAGTSYPGAKASSSQPDTGARAEGAVPSAGLRPGRAASRARSRSGGKASKPSDGRGKPSFLELVESGFMAHGNYNFTVGSNQDVNATVEPDGA